MRCLDGYGIASHFQTTGDISPPHFPLDTSAFGRHHTSNSHSRHSMSASEMSESGDAAPAFEMVVLGSGGGPLETDSSGCVRALVAMTSLNAATSSSRTTANGRTASSLSRAVSYKHKGGGNAC